MQLIYVTFSTKDEAIKIANKLIGDKLAACVSIYDGVTSIYEWEGKIQQNNEVTAICKVSDEATDKVISLIKNNHQYSCPCVIAIKVAKGNEDFLKWVDNCGKVGY